MVCRHIDLTRWWWSDVYLQIWGVTVAMNTPEDMHHGRSTYVPVTLYCNIVDFIGSCCRLFVGWIIYFCLRIYIKLFQGIHKFSFLDKM